MLNLLTPKKTKRIHNQPFEVMGLPMIMHKSRIFRRWQAFALSLALFTPLSVAIQTNAMAKDLRFITLAPGHFHAALVQKQMLPGVAPTVTVYAPLGLDLTEHIKRVVGFNTRVDSPTTWALDVHAGADFVSQFRNERPGSVVVISGRNAGKISLIETAIDAGMHVLVDKPWIIEASDFEKLSGVLAKAKKKKLLAYDIMTERFEPTNALQKALVNTPDVFGQLQTGTAQAPGVYIENVHHFMKSVAGKLNLRPTWFFDSQQQGEGMADTGTHLVDLVQWTLAPEQVLDANRDVQVVGAQRWSTNVSAEQFQTVTGTEAPFPSELKVFANTQVTYKLRGAFVGMASMWNWQAPAGGGDWHYAVYRGSRANVEIRQGSKEKFVPELFVVPNAPSDWAMVEKALTARIAELSAAFPGVAVKTEGPLLHVVIPAALRMGHEAHFSEVTRMFLGYLRTPSSLPAWESANMLAKYTVTTQASKLSREAPPLASFVSKAPR